MHQTYTDLYMTDLVTLFKEDLLKIILELEKNKIIKDFNKNSLGIDISSKSKQGDFSTNILIILNKKKNK